MQTTTATRKAKEGKLARVALTAALVLAASAPMLAQVAPYGEKTMGDPPRITSPTS